MWIAFDVDGTLINSKDLPRDEVISMLRLLSKYNKILVWSGGGVDYARMWVDRLEIEEYVNLVSYKDNKIQPDVAFDDEADFKLGKINIQV